MFQIFEYYGRYQGVRAQLTALPGWARAVLVIVAVPGIVLASLSILAFVVSLLALLVLTVPVYRLLKIVTGTTMGRKVQPDEPPAHPNRRHVDVKIVE